MLVYGLILLPAYGRNYQSPEACKADWEAGKDFLIMDGPYCSVRDAKAMHTVGFKSLYLVAPSGQLLHEAVLAQYAQG